MTISSPRQRGLIKTFTPWYHKYRSLRQLARGFAGFDFACHGHADSIEKPQERCRILDVDVAEGVPDTLAAGVFDFVQQLAPAVGDHDHHLAPVVFGPLARDKVLVEQPV